MVYRPKLKELEESKTSELAVQHDVEHQSEVRLRDPQSQPATSDFAGTKRSINKPQHRDIVLDSAKSAQDAFMKEKEEKAAFAKAFQNIHFNGGEITDNVSIVLDRFDNNSDNAIV